MTTRASWGSLESRIEGELVLPGSPDFDVAYRALNARFDDVQPLAIVRCTNPDDVAEVIRFAGTHGMEVGTRGGGHCFGGRSSSGGLLVDVTRMHAVEVSGGAVTVGGGTRIGEVYASLLQHDLAIPAGSCPSVGIAGLALGGGLGIIGRRYGLSSDHLLGAQIVLADGRIVECDEHHEEDLFWALRGAGAGNFGVVTSLTFGTIPAPAATNFHLAWSFSEAAAAIDAWQSWAPAAPEREGHRGAPGELHQGRGRPPVSRARFLAVGRRLQPDERGCHRLRPSRRPLLAKAHHRGRPRRVGGYHGGGARVGCSVLGHRASLGHGAGVPELPRSGSEGLGPRLLRNQPGATAEHQGPIRSREPVSVPTVAAGALEGFDSVSPPTATRTRWSAH